MGPGGGEGGGGLARKWCQGCRPGLCVCVCGPSFVLTDTEKGFFRANFLYMLYFWSTFASRGCDWGEAEAEVGADGQGRLV